jgi:hypothetical protein
MAFQLVGSLEVAAAVAVDLQSIDRNSRHGMVHGLENEHAIVELAPCQLR